MFLLAYAIFIIHFVPFNCSIISPFLVILHFIIFFICFSSCLTTIYFVDFLANLSETTFVSVLYLLSVCYLSDVVCLWQHFCLFSVYCLCFWMSVTTLLPVGYLLPVDYLLSVFIVFCNNFDSLELSIFFSVCCLWKILTDGNRIRANFLL